ncbi:MAG: XRE family transcriptional regulator [Rhizobium sp.]|nr:XRE family transcriptional regulator [Rhizobium sp.]
MSKLSYDNIFDAMTEDDAEAADLRFRADLLLTLRKVIESKGWKQAEIAEVLDVSQPRVSELMRGKIELFSADKLIGLLAKLNIRLKPLLGANGRVVCEVTDAA